MKIAYIAIKGFNLAGGIEKYTEEVGSRLAARGHEVTVYSMRHYGTKQDTMHKGMRIKTLPSINSKGLQKISTTFLASLHQFALKDCDILHYQAVGPSLFAFLPRFFSSRISYSPGRCTGPDMRTEKSLIGTKIKSSDSRVGLFHNSPK